MTQAPDPDFTLYRLTRSPSPSRLRRGRSRSPPRHSGSMTRPPDDRNPHNTNTTPHQKEIHP